MNKLLYSRSDFKTKSATIELEPFTNGDNTKH